MKICPNNEIHFFVGIRQFRNCFHNKTACKLDGLYPTTINPNLVTCKKCKEEMAVEPKSGEK